MQTPITNLQAIQPINEIARVSSPKVVEEYKSLAEAKKITEVSAQPKSEEEIPVDVAKFQKFFEENQITLKFSRDKETEALIVELIDQKTGQSVLQMPSEVSLKLAAELGKLQGLFVNQKA